MGRLTKDVWLSLETEYRAALVSVDDLATKYGVHRNAINRRATKEGWTRVPAELKRQMVDAKIRAMTEAVGDKCANGLHAQLEVESNHDAAVLNKAARTFEKILAKLNEAVDEVPADAILALKTMAEATDKAQSGYSKVRRLDEKPPEASPFEATVKRLMEGK